MFDGDNTLAEKGSSDFCSPVVRIIVQHMNLQLLTNQILQASGNVWRFIAYELQSEDVHASNSIVVTNSSFEVRAEGSRQPRT